MEISNLPTEVILTNSRQSLGKLQLDWIPQPGNYLDVDGKTYTVLERRHRYQLKLGRYHLHDIAIYVQKVTYPLEKSLFAGRWVIGDATCNYNAHSEIIRCAVNPEGPCNSCKYYERNNK
ncbi:hypothetical protein H6F32_00385 [Anabaena sp. FACHB-1237]|uniref:DUF6464 family protein n=1 Tax=Anabaena sp. FACHB-1237 TaxID=2692769 RepID=UPI00168179B9|nr:DUF6464 family protein [Anabaena sp. FACHB-1237]MBD2136074.1 hypothetical protein [Anabaena sp. FACHB-1237]